MTNYYRMFNHFSNPFNLRKSYSKSDFLDFMALEEVKNSVYNCSYGEEVNALYAKIYFLCKIEFVQHPSNVLGCRQILRIFQRIEKENKNQE